MEEKYIQQKQNKEEEARNQNKFGGLSVAQLEELYAFFKAKEQQERTSGKNFCVINLQWVLDSGASHHMTNNFHILYDVIRLPRPIYITTANDETITVQVAETAMIYLE